MKQTYDNLMREALRRRAERIAPLPSDIAERVAERIGHRRRTMLRPWTWAASISAAAAIVVGVFILWHEPSVPTTTPQPPVAENVPPSPIPPQGEGIYPPAPISKAIRPKEDVPQVSKHSAPSLTGRAGEQSDPAPSLSELYTSIDEMTDAALQEADRLTVEAMTCGLSDDHPS